MSDVFVSYAHKDRKHAENLTAALRAAGLDVAAEPTVANEESTVSPAAREAIAQSRCVLVVHSKNTRQSPRIAAEVHEAVDTGRAVLVASFGKAEMPDDFPAEVRHSVRLTIPSSLTEAKKADLVNAVRRRVAHQPITPVVAMMNMKGGVGKTALSANIFGCIHKYRDKSILLIDMDPQHNLSQLMIDITQLGTCWEQGRSIAKALEDCTGKATPEQWLDMMVLPLRTYAPDEPRLDLIVGHFNTVAFSLRPEQHDLDLARRSFLSVIEAARQRYDAIVLDVNPGASFMTDLALRASTHILSPIRPDRFSRYGLELLDNLLGEMRAPDDRYELFGIMNAVEGEAEGIESSIRAGEHMENRYGRTILDARIPISKRLQARIPRLGVSDLTADLPYHGGMGTGPVRRALQEAANEIVEKMQI